MRGTGLHPGSARARGGRDDEGAEQPIRVLQVVPSLALDSGVTSFIRSMFDHRDPKRVHYDFLHHDVEDGVPRHENCLDKRFRDEGARIFTLPFARSDMRGFVEGSRIFFDDHAGEFDVVHCHMPNLAFVLLRDARRSGVACRIIHSHFTSSSDRPLRRLRNAPLLALGKRYGTGRLACSKAAGDYLFGKGGYEVIRNGIEVARFEFDHTWRHGLREELGVGDRPVIGCVGRLSPQKNYRQAIDVFAEFRKRSPEAVLVIVGEGEGNEASELRRLSDEKGVGESVCLLGVRTDVNRLYSAVDVFFMPSLYEGLPIAAVEAQASGLPCVFSSDVSREVDIIGSSDFVDRGDAASTWADALERAVVRGRTANASELLAKRGYSAADNAARLMDYYERQLGR